MTTGILRPSQRVAVIAAVPFIATVIMFVFLENHLIFAPRREPRQSWQPPLPSVEEVVFRSDDDVELSGWFFPHPQPRAVVLFCNGNAGNLSYWSEVYAALNTRLQAAVLGFDYRGYGRSSGRPSERGVLADARAAQRWLSARTHTPAGKIVLMGRSLGGGVAIDLARNGCRAVIVENTFTTLPDVAAKIFPYLPVRTFMRSRFASIEKITRISAPFFVSHGDAEELVPFEMGKRLYDASPSDLKHFFIVPGGGHNDPQPTEYYRQLDQFLEALPP